MGLLRQRAEASLTGQMSPVALCRGRAAYTPSGNGGDGARVSEARPTVRFQTSADNVFQSQQGFNLCISDEGHSIFSRMFKNQYLVMV